jgi:ubiquinone/menaquinone biosynthesis C-methylase UbiE
MRAWEKNINSSIESYLDSSYEKCASYERFKFIKDILRKKLKNGKSFLDIGCAKGEFIWYLKDFFPGTRFTGIDISGKLISLARKEPKLKDATFMRGSALNFDLKKKFDFVLMNGVLSIFDDFPRPLRRMMKHLKRGGWGYIFGCFTKSDIDVLVRYRNNFLGSRKWESGLNMFSLKTIEKALRPFSERTKFYRFDLPIDLARKKNPVRSYTVNTGKGRIILNGANILNQLYLVEFKKR